MKIEKTKNASRNIIFGFTLKLYQLLLPFIMRTVIMYAIGVQYLGLNSLFTSILQVLNLAELGVGSAMVFSMYKPIAEDDSVTICALMKLYRLYYRIIGGIILVIGLILTPFVPYLIAGDVPANINIYVLYILNLLATVLTYWLFAYRNSILQAYQRTDIVSKVTICTDTIKYLLQIAALVVFRNYYYYVIAVLITQSLNNILTALISTKLFPNYGPKGKFPKNEIKTINNKIKDLFTSKLGYTIVSSADTIVISAFLGLTVLAQYQNYYYIMSSVIGFVSIIFSSITAGVGNSMLVKSVEDNYSDFKVFTLLITFFCGICVSCFLCLYQPFMKLWMGEDMLLSFGMVVLFCIYFWFYEIVMMVSVYKDAGGIWHEDRFRPLMSGLVNLCLNLLMVHFIGLFGILLSTIISVCVVSVPWIICNVFRLIFKINSKQYITMLIRYTCCIFLSASITYFITAIIPGQGWVSLIAKAIVTVVSSTCLLYIFLRCDSNFNKAKTLLFRLLRIDAILSKIKR